MLDRSGPLSHAVSTQPTACERINPRPKNWASSVLAFATLAPSPISRP
jgi:hypothetical protein